MTAVRYRDEVLDPSVKLYAATVSSSFVLMDDNVRLYRDVIVYDCLESEGIGRMEWLAYPSDFIPIENI